MTIETIKDKLIRAKKSHLEAAHDLIDGVLEDLNKLAQKIADERDELLEKLQEATEHSAPVVAINDPVATVHSFNDLGGQFDWVSPTRYRPPVGASLFAAPVHQPAVVTKDQIIADLVARAGVMPEIEFRYDEHDWCYAEDVREAIAAMQAKFESAQPEAGQEPLGFMNAGYVHELQERRLPYGYVYPEAGTGAEVPVYLAPQPEAMRPAFTGVAKRKLDSLIAEGYRISGFAIECDDEKAWKRGFITTGGFVGWWSQNMHQAHQVKGNSAADLRLPLTQEQVVDGFCKTTHQVQYVSVFDAGVRFAEKYHGIVAYSTNEGSSE